MEVQEGARVGVSQQFHLQRDACQLKPLLYDLFGAFIVGVLDICIFYAHCVDSC